MLGTRNIPELMPFAAQHELRHLGQIADLKDRLTTRGRGGRPAVRSVDQSSYDRLPIVRGSISDEDS
jgi:hypothetical protein